MRTDVRTRKTTPKQKPAESKTATSKGAGYVSAKANSHSEIGAEERTRMIALNAYLRAEGRGFEGGDPVRDWLDAESEVDTMLAGSGVF